MKTLIFLLLLSVSVTSAKASFISLFNYDFENGSLSPFRASVQRGASAVNLTSEVSRAEAVITVKPDGSSSNWIVGFRGNYIKTLNAETDLSRLSLSFRMRADFADTGVTAGTVRVRIFGFGTSGSNDTLYRDFTVTTQHQTFDTTLDTWSGNATDFNPTTEAHILYFDFGAATGADPWPVGPIGGDGLRLFVDHVHYRAARPATPPDPVEYFISPTGSNAADGLSEGTAFATIQHAASRANPGDTITVMDGEYTEAILIHRSGSPDSWITFRAQNRHQAKISNPNRDVFRIGNTEHHGVSYIVIDGFDLMAPGRYASGVKSNWGAHHLRIINNYAHDCGESGISLNAGDYRIIENNIVARNGWLMPAAGSGISLYGLIPFDDAPGYHSIVRNNIAFHNDNGPQTAKTDGNGIIIDDFRNVQRWHPEIAVKDINYEGQRTLVEGNLVFGNGGKGIQVFLSNNVDVFNNTAFLNNTRLDTATWRGELSVSASRDVVFANNIAVTDSSPVDGEQVFTHNRAFQAGQPNPNDSYSRDNFFYNNLTFDLANPSSPSFSSTGIAISFTPEDGNILAADPMFLDPLVDENLEALMSAPSAFFGLHPNSPARNAGRYEFIVGCCDIAGRKRMTAGNVDMGAFAFSHETIAIVQSALDSTLSARHSRQAVNSED
jgi:parallel beta-helix repeat protein